MSHPVEIGIRNSHVRGVLSGLGQFFLISSYCLSFWYGGKLISEGEMEFMDVLKVFFAIVMVAMSVGQTASMTPDAAKVNEISLEFKIFTLLPGS